MVTSAISPPPSSCPAMPSPVFPWFPTFLVSPPLWYGTFYPNSTLGELARPCATQRVVFLHPEHALYRDLDPLPRYLPGLDGSDDSVVGVGLLLRRAGDEEQVRTSLDRLDRRPCRRPAACRP